MIPATHSVFARYSRGIQGDDGTLRKSYDYKRVIAFDEHGNAMVLPEKKALRLVRADHYNNFEGLSEQEKYSDVVTLIPGDGWRVEHTGDGDEVWSEPLVGWALREDGTIVPLDTDSVGYVETLDDAGKGRWRLYHPDLIEPPEVSDDKSDE